MLWESIPCLQQEQQVLVTMVSLCRHTTVVLSPHPHVFSLLLPLSDLYHKSWFTVFYYVFSN